MKMFKHIPTYSVFQGLKISANSNDTQYTVGVDGNIINGVPDIKWQSIAFIKDVQKIWTHGQLYDCSGGGASNIAIYETADDVYNGVLTSSVLINDILSNFNIYTIVIKQRIAAGRYNIFVFNRCSERDAGTAYFSCLYTNDSEHILYKLSYLDTSIAITLTKQDLALKSDIPSAVTESTVSDWGFTKNAGTITGVSANGTSVATSGVANIPAASTSAYGVTKLSSATNSTSEVLAATPKAVKAAYDLANSYKGTITEVKMNGVSKGTSGVVDLGNVGNITAVDTGDVLDDVNTNYATVAYVDGLVGDINSVLESIINGGGTVTQQYNNIYYAVTMLGDSEGYNYFWSDYPVESDVTITASYLHPIKGELSDIYTISKGNTEINEMIEAANSYENITISPEQDSKYIYNLLKIKNS